MELSLPQALQKAIEAQKAGRVDEARQLYLAILQVQPTHPTANFNMGKLAVELNRLQEALPFFTKAYEAKPANSQFVHAYVVALVELRHMNEAKSVLMQAKTNGAKSDELDYLEKHLNGSDVEQTSSSELNILDTLKLDQALRLAQKKSKEGLRSEALKICKDVLIKFPQNKKAIELVAMLQSNSLPELVQNTEPPQLLLQPMIDLYSTGQLHKALAQVTQLLLQFPQSIVLHNIHGVANAGLGRLDIAINSFKKVLHLKPDDAEAHNNMGTTQKARGDLDAAIASYKQAIKIKPDYAEAHNNMGTAQKARGDLDAAIASYKQAIKIKPDHTNAHFNMGNALKDKGDLGAAIESYRQAINIKPDYAEAHYNLGIAFADKGDLDASIESYQKAIKIKPDYVEAYYNMGNVLNDKGDLDASIDSYKQAIKIKPDYELAHSQKLHQQAMICDWTEIEEDREIIIKLGTSEQDISPFVLMTFEDAPERNRLRSEIHAQTRLKQKPIPLPTIPTQKPKRLRVGYFSSDFRQHSVGIGISNIFASHNRERFEIYGYSFGPDDGSKIRQKIIESVDVFDDVKEMKEKDIALLARQDEIDIAIDLNGYTAKSRPGIFAYRAAPIQIHFWGSANSMGTDSIDYYIGEDLCIPKEYEHGYSESIIRLPHWFQAKYNTEAVSDLPMTRADMGLPEQGFVFCCFNNSYKISSVEFDIWMRLLSKVSGSVLWVLKSNDWMEQNLQQEAQKRGIPAERLVFAERVPHPIHLARQRLADLLLDTFNVNAGVTAGDALWVGLPIVTKLGKGLSARICGSLLKAIGMPELITETEQEYEALILDLATNPKRLSSIKRKLAGNRLSKPLFNTELFTKHLEDGYQQAYQRYFDGKNPANIYVNEQPKPAP